MQAGKSDHWIEDGRRGGALAVGGASFSSSGLAGLKNVVGLSQLPSLPRAAAECVGCARFGAGRLRVRWDCAGVMAFLLPGAQQSWRHL